MMPDELSARAPYNFVPLPDERIDVLPPPSGDQYWQGWFTGSIEYTLTAETPLFIGATPSGTTEAAVFFAPAGRPLIPGSSLRGMLSTLVEIMTWAQPRVLDDRLLFYRAIPQHEDPLGERYLARLRAAQAGWIRHVGGGTYALRPASTVPRARGRTFFRVGASVIDASFTPRQRPGPWTRTMVWFDPESIEFPHGADNDAAVKAVSVAERDGWERGALIQPARPVAAGWQALNHAWIVPVPDGGASPIQLDEEIVREYLGMRGEDRGGVTRAVHQHHFAVIPEPGRESDLWASVGGAEGALRGSIPAFFVTDGMSVYFGHTRYFRVPYRKRLRDGVPLELRQAPGDPWDVAQSLFGYVSDSAEAPAWRGRLAFEDAELLGEPVWEQPAAPSALFAPRPTSFQHYLDQPMDGDPPPHTRSWDEADGSSVEDSRTTGTRIAGWKLYWHRYRGPARRPDVPWQRGADRGHMEAQGPAGERREIQPLARGSHFRARIRFENLEVYELSALVAALELPGGLRHHLGFGKPLGMGSVRIEVTTIGFEDRQASDRYRRLDRQMSAVPRELPVAAKLRDTDIYHYLARPLGRGSVDLATLDPSERHDVVALLRQPFFDWAWSRLHPGERWEGAANLWSSEAPARMEALRALLQYDLDGRIGDQEPWASTARWEETAYMPPQAHQRNVRLPSPTNYERAHFLPP